MVEVKRTRRRSIRRSSWKSWVGFLLLINIVPIVGFSYIAWRMAQGDIHGGFRELVPESVSQNGPYLCALIVLLGLFAWGILPAAQGGGRWIAEVRARSAERRREGGAIRRAWEAILLPPRLLLFGFFYLLRGVSLVGTLAVILLFVFFMVRMTAPERVKGWMPLPGDIYVWLGTQWQALSR